MNRRGSTRQRVCRAAARWVGLALACLMGATAAGADEPELKLSYLTIGFPRQAFANLNENDVLAAYRTFIIAAGRLRGWDVRPEMTVFETMPQFRDAIRRGAVHIGMLSPWQLFETDLMSAVDIEYVPVSGGSATHRLLLLTRHDAGIHDWGDLRGKSILLLRDSRTTLARPWIETRCIAGGLGAPQDFFAEVDYASKPHAAILPVFFGRKAACVVDEPSYRTACELNPQLEKQITVVASSAPLLEAVVCLNRIGWHSEQQRNAVKEAMAEMNATPGGQQIMTVFRITRLDPFEPGLLETVAALYAEHERVAVPAPASVSYDRTRQPVVTR